MARRNRSTRRPQRNKSTVPARVDRVISQLVGDAWDALLHMSTPTQDR